MTKLYALAVITTLLLLHSCKSASKSFQKGDYTDAIERGVKKLQKDPNDYETRDLVQKSYNYTVNEHEDQIRILSNSKADNRFDKIYSEYVSLQNLYTTVHEYPAVAQMIKVKDYSEFVETYRDKAADMHTVKGMNWMEEGTRDAYREAYRELNLAVSYHPDDYQLKKKRDSAYDAAVVKVVISPIQNYARGYRYTSSYQFQNFQRDVIRTLTYNMNNDFVKFYSDLEASSKNIEPDQVMELNFSRISIGQPSDQRNSREISRQIPTKQDSVTTQYTTIQGTITTTKRSLLSQADLFITVRDTKGRILWNDQFTGEHRWQTEFSYFSGDERVLNDADKALLKQSNNTTPPDENQIMDNLMRQIQNDLTYRLRNYYVKYQ